MSRVKLAEGIALEMIEDKIPEEDKKKMPRVKLAEGIALEIIEDKIPEEDKKKRGRPPGSKNVKSSKKSKQHLIHTDNEQEQGGNSGPAEPNRNQGADLGIASSREIWVETKAGGGKSYYCNATTGVTQWTVPRGKDVKILTRDEAEVFQKKIQENGAASKDDGQKDGEDLQEEIQESGEASKDDGGKVGEDLQEKIQESGEASKKYGEKAGEDLQEEIQESGAAFKDDGEKDGEDLQEEERPEDDQETTCDWSEHTSGAVCSGKKYYYNRKTGKSVWEKPQELQDFESRVPEFQQHSRHQVHNEQGHSGMPRNDGVPLNLPIQDPFIQTRPSVVQQVPSQPAHGRSGRPLSAQDQQHVQHQALVTHGQQPPPAATTRGHPQALLTQGQQLLPAASTRGHPQVNLTQGHYNIKIKIQVEIEMSTEQFSSVGQALFRNRHQNDRL